MKRFLSGDEAFAEGVRLARPQVISAYPITPQTVVVERLSEMVEDGSLASEYVHVESEHSALSCAIGASATGARTFTATSSQGLLYMAECLTYASGGRFPIVMMNANRATALPWNIYGDQRDSLALLDHGWIQVYAQDNQEALDLALMAYAVAEDPRVMTPVMVNLDGFALTHTYETVDVPEPSQADAFLSPYDGSANRFDFENPVNIGFSAGPEYNRYFKYWEHRDMCAATEVISEVEARFAEVFGREYSGTIEEYRCDDAQFVLVTLGSLAGLARATVDKLRARGIRAGLLRIRYMRPFPAAAIARALAGAQAVGVLEKDISFGAEGAVFTNVVSALQQAGNAVPAFNFVGGLGGDDVSETQMEEVFETLHFVAEGKVGVAALTDVSIGQPTFDEGNLDVGSENGLADGLADGMADGLAFAVEGKATAIEERSAASGENPLVAGEGVRLQSIAEKAPAAAAPTLARVTFLGIDPLPQNVSRETFVRETDGGRSLAFISAPDAGRGAFDREAIGREALDAVVPASELASASELESEPAPAPVAPASAAPSSAVPATLAASSLTHTASTCKSSEEKTPTQETEAN